jgi:hypothetical protein
MAPRMLPSASPDQTSRCMTRHHWPSATSPRASARMARVAAWEPELPPLEMIRGTKSARTTARSISFSKKPMAVAVSISPRNRTVSQPARRRSMDANGISRYGSSRASTPPNRWSVRVAADSATSSTSSMVTMPMSVPPESVTGRATRPSRWKTGTADSWTSVAFSATTRTTIASATRVAGGSSSAFRIGISPIRCPRSSMT